MRLNLLYFFLIISLSLKAQSLESIEFGTDSTFDILTWNIEWFPKNGQITIDSVSKIIESTHADIIACQEIDDTALFNTMLAGIPNYNAIYDPNNFEGLAYIYNTSSISIIDDYSLFTNSNFWRPFPRAPYLIKVQFDNQIFIIINNHLKCCGDGILNTSVPTDEENRRYEASVLLESYVQNNFLDDNVVIVGDLNDELTDPIIHNVFQPFYDALSLYQFADQNIAQGSSSNWSYPSWPSHLDHILITNELFQSFNHPYSSVSTLPIDDFLPNGFSNYDSDISDHLPVGLKLWVDPSLLTLTKYKNVENISIFPNPARNHINIVGSSSFKSTTLIISDLYGKQLQQFLITDGGQTITIPISHFNTGVYYITLISHDNRIQHQKLIIY